MVKGQTEKLDQGWSIRVRVQSKARTLDCGCDPGLEDEYEGVVQGLIRRLDGQMWSRTRGFNW